MVLLGSISLSRSPDSWSWELDPSVEFTVRSIRRHLDGIRLPAVNQATRCNRFVPIKINIFLWRVLLDRLPCRPNILVRGVDVDSVLSHLCPIFQEVEESISYLLFGGITLDIFSTMEMVNWVEQKPAARLEKNKMESICIIVIWILWTYPNVIIFRQGQSRKQFLFDIIHDHSVN
ncbi:hypothetical protein LXL04_019090 [Taraxacum kok-saghyz]